MLVGHNPGMHHARPDSEPDETEVIEWIARQPWCTGKIGMMGKSWGAYNSLQVAERQPPALKAIIAVGGPCATLTVPMHSEMVQC